MARIFLILTLFAVALLGVNIVLGLRIGDYHADALEYRAAHQQFDELNRERSPSQPDLEKAKARSDSAAAALIGAKERFVLHFLFGLTAALVTVLVNSVSVTYFIGTSRWCREVVEAYGLSDELIERSNRIKRRSFPWSLGGITTILVVIMLGAAADPGRAVDSSSWVIIHYIAALGGTAFIALSLLMQVSHIAANFAVIDEILAEVTRIRKERGLD